MPAYILRIANTKRFIGLYAADNEDDLCFLIDEETDPGDYEYAILRGGFGIELRRADHRPIRYRIGRGSEALARAREKLDYVYMTSELLGALAYGDNLTWIALAES
jgi:hypothetical protein